MLNDMRFAVRVLFLLEPFEVRRADPMIALSHNT